jgi:hypothetical protein
MTTPTAGVDYVVIPLPDSNACTMDLVPVFQDIPYGGGIDLAADAVADHFTVNGSLSTLLYPSLAAFILNAAVTRNDGTSLPWATTEPTGDLASFSLYKAVTNRSGTVKRYWYPGCKVGGLQLDVSRQDPKARIKIDIVGQEEKGNAIDASADPTATPFPVPAETDYAKGPYTFSHTGGYLIWNTTALAQYESLSLKLTNKLDPRFYESKFLSTCGWHGRSASLDVALLFKATPNLRNDMEALTARALSLTFNNGTKTASFTFNAKNRVKKATYDIPLGKEIMQNVTFMNYWDPAAATDITVATT